MRYGSVLSVTSNRKLPLNIQSKSTCVALLVVTNDKRRPGIRPVEALLRCTTKRKAVRIRGRGRQGKIIDDI
ncbi:hypothetical protein Ahy_B02g057392 isoform G [Arachis hypogaea]|uniref:Uncharacterized protein n=1 Tax=Arachis hypogaea TaxID=3818 RepID=A0A445AC39_ARAHY|nr:hypothetical protein Ahy_B02g057392 isoform G [Arachis hypogaea]